jgi:hypothetical protein
MIDLIKQALESPAGSFGFVFSILVLAFWLVHWVTKKVTTINNSHSELNKKIDKMETNIDDIKTDLSFLKGSFDFLKESFNIYKKGISPVTASFSPVSLTKTGIETAKKLNAEAMIAKNWDKIYNDLEKNISNKNAYDIQKYCIDTAGMYLDRFISNSDIDFLKILAYKEGNSLLYYTPIFGVLIRDKYLSIKEIDVSEVDEHDPNKNPLT